MTLSPQEEDHILLNRLYAELLVQHGEVMRAVIRGMVSQVQEHFPPLRTRNYTSPVYLLGNRAFSMDSSYLAQTASLP